MNKAYRFKQRVICIALLPSLVGLGWYASSETRCAHAQGFEATAPTTPAKTKDRLREGTELVDVTGHFKLTGDRATFYLADGSARFNGLENLTLERVSTVIAEDPTPMERIVTGKITEFKGNNYLLITRAILKAKSPAQQPFSAKQ